ncbi:MAG: thioredoxin family protein [Bacteroidales bacterium]
MRKIIYSLFLVLFSMALFAQEAPKPYHPEADAKAELKAALDRAKKENKHVLIQIGGNWCPWCLRFHAMAKGAPVIDSIIRADYVYTLLNYSKENKNPELMKQFEYPGRFGFPVFVILDKNGKLLHTQDSGILEHCQVKGYDTTKVFTFLKMWNVKALDPATYQGK